MHTANEQHALAMPSPVSGLRIVTFESTQHERDRHRGEARMRSTTHERPPSPRRTTRQTAPDRVMSDPDSPRLEAHHCEPRDLDQPRVDLAKIARLAFPDLPATEARRMLRREEAQAFIHTHGHPRPDQRITLDRTTARRLRARLDPTWPPPAPPEVRARRHVHLRADTAARRTGHTGTETRLMVDLEEFALLRSASLLEGSTEAPHWPSTDTELAAVTTTRLTPAAGSDGTTTSDPVDALGDLTATAPQALAGLLGPARRDLLELALAHTWFGYARSVAALWHEPDSPDFGFSVSTILAALPEEFSCTQARDDLGGALEQVRAR